LSNEKDTVVESQEIKVVYETSIEGYVQNAIVDFSDSWYSKGFTIRGGALSSC
jgi:Fe-S cluster assembly iron-binding protein IscA